MDEKPRILILGVGNILMGDEGIGVHFIRTLEGEKLPSNVSLLDGGTAGLQLMQALEECDVAIIIDATIDKEGAGRIVLRQPKYSSEYPNSLSTHDIGLKDLVEGLALRDKLPKVYLYTVSITELRHMDMELSVECKEALPILKGKVLALIEEIAN